MLAGGTEEEACWVGREEALIRGQEALVIWRDIAWIDLIGRQVALVVGWDVALIGIVLSRSGREGMVVAGWELVVRIAGLLCRERCVGVVIDGIGVSIVVALVAHLISELLELLWGSIHYLSHKDDFPYFPCGTSFPIIFKH